MELLECHNCQVVSLSDFAAWHRGTKPLHGQAVVITFDDGFADFASEAFPELQRRRWPATVFLPAAKIGGREDWAGSAQVPRKLLDWDDIREMAAAGIEFGSHTMSHPELTSLPPEELQHEIRQPRAAIAEQLGTPPTSFAAPYGSSNPAVREAISQVYEVAVGTRLARCRRTCDVFDAPRIEMHYFRDPKRFDSFLNGGRKYLAVRQALRRFREVVVSHSI